MFNLILFLFLNIISEQIIKFEEILNPDLMISFLNYSCSIITQILILNLILL